MAILVTIKERFVQQLNQAFETIRKDDGSPYTPDDIQTIMGGITASYIWRLRKGRIDNPTIHVVGLLADFFGVSPSYFIDVASLDDGNATAPRRLVQTAHERLATYTDGELEFLLVMMDQLERLRK